MPRNMMEYSNLWVVTLLISAQITHTHARARKYSKKYTIIYSHLLTFFLFHLVDIQQQPDPPD